MNDPKRAEIKARIAAAQEREQERNRSFAGQLGDKASDATEAFTDFARRHPLTTVAGGLAVGILIAGMFKGPRRAAASGGAKAAGLAAIAAETVAAFASQMLDAAEDAGREGARKLDGIGDRVADQARSLGRGGSHRAADLGDAARTASHDVGRAISRALSRH